ncbi:MAG: SUMF1/EgtB/PvdO family nonheme iron enzyme [Tannerellaceae bacterium]|nr:SUMF1/EgtB/PvdO family nonheme iron enzyme [Tannerellaceae bacterium]
MKTLKANSGIVWGFIFQVLLSVPLYASQQADSIRTLQIKNLKEQLRWIHPEAVKDYLEDIAKEAGETYGQLQNQYKTFYTLYEKTIPLLDQEQITDEAYNRLKELQKIHRQIMLANPLLDTDQILITRYKLGDRDRRSMGPQLGTAPANYSSLFSGRRSGYDAEISLLTNLRKDIQTTTIYKPESDAPVSDMQLHWQADKILFTSLDQERKWQIYEVSTDGTNLQQKIQSEEPDLEFCDANYLPDGRVVATTNIGYNGVPCVHGDDIVANLISYDPGTGAIQRLTFDQDGNWSPIVMPNGRLMYTRWEYTDLTHYFSRIVMHMNPDGTENKALYGSGSYFPNSTFDMKPLSKHSGRFIGIISGHHGVARSGRLIIFDPAKGRKEEKGMIQELPFRNRPIIPIIKDELVNGVWPQFMKPYPLNDHYFLTAAKLSPDGLWGIYLVDVFDNLTLIAEYEGEGLTSPILLKETEMPPVIPSKIKPEEKEATLFIQDIYEGEGSIGIPRGKIKSLRIFAYEYAYIKSPSDHDAQGIQSGWDIKRILGTVPVEEDGSVMFKVPANTPISIQPLDENGAAVQWMRSWLTGMPGEIVSCIGCHEDQNTIPLPKRTLASAQAPRTLTTPKGGIRPFTFALEVQPVLDRNCISCHDGISAQPDLRGGNMVKYERGRLTKIERWMDQSYLNLHPYVYRQGPEADIYVLKPYEYYANNSELIRILEAGHHGIELPEEDLQTLYTWIDLNAPYFGAFTQLQPLNGIDQVKRRQELAEKYSNSKVDWQKEIEDYAAWLKTNSDRTPRTPQQKAFPKTKTVHAKGFPFDPQTALQKQEAANQNEKKITLAPGVDISFVWIPAGTFVMGDNNQPLTSPAFKTTVKKGFWMSRTEITNEQFTTLFPEHDSRYIGQTWKDHTTPGYPANEATQPVVRVSWEEANTFCREVKALTGENIALPTETQWEWAARAGNDTPFWYGSLTTDFSMYENLADSTLVDLAVTGVNPRPMSPTDPMRTYWDYQPKVREVNDGQLISAPVASYTPNPWGLFDMHGNVAEWTRSSFQKYPLKESESGEEKKVVRGGSWIERPKDATAASRKAYYPWQRPFNVGFRIIIEE